PLPRMFGGGPAVGPTAVGAIPARGSIGDTSDGDTSGENDSGDEMAPTPTVMEICSRGSSAVPAPRGRSMSVGADDSGVTEADEDSYDAGLGPITMTEESEKVRHELGVAMKALPPTDKADRAELQTQIYAEERLQAAMQKFENRTYMMLNPHMQAVADAKALPVSGFNEAAFTTLLQTLGSARVPQETLASFSDLNAREFASIAPPEFKTWVTITYLTPAIEIVKAGVERRQVLNGGTISAKDQTLLTLSTKLLDRLQNPDANKSGIQTMIKHLSTPGGFQYFVQGKMTLATKGADPKAHNAFYNDVNRLVRPDSTRPVVAASARMVPSEGGAPTLLSALEGLGESDKSNPKTGPKGPKAGTPLLTTWNGYVATIEGTPITFSPRPDAFAVPLIHLDLNKLNAKNVGAIKAFINTVYDDFEKTDLDVTQLTISLENKGVMDQYVDLLCGTNKEIMMDHLDSLVPKSKAPARRSSAASTAPADPRDWQLGTNEQALRAFVMGNSIKIPELSVFRGGNPWPTTAPGVLGRTNSDDASAPVIVHKMANYDAAKRLWGTQDNVSAVIARLGTPAEGDQYYDEITNLSQALQLFPAYYASSAEPKQQTVSVRSGVEGSYQFKNETHFVLTADAANAYKQVFADVDQAKKALMAKLDLVDANRKKVFFNSFYNVEIQQPLMKGETVAANKFETLRAFLYERDPLLADTGNGAGEEVASRNALLNMMDTVQGSRSSNRDPGDDIPFSTVNEDNLMQRLCFFDAKLTEANDRDVKSSYITLTPKNSDVEVTGMDNRNTSYRVTQETSKNGPILVFEDSKDNKKYAMLMMTHNGGGHYGVQYMSKNGLEQDYQVVSGTDIRGFVSKGNMMEMLVDSLPLMESVSLVPLDQYKKAQQSSAFMKAQGTTVNMNNNCWMAASAQYEARFAMYEAALNPAVAAAPPVMTVRSRRAAPSVTAYPELDFSKVSGTKRGEVLLAILKKVKSTYHDIAALQSIDFDAVSPDDLVSNNSETLTAVMNAVPVEVFGRDPGFQDNYGTDNIQVSHLLNHLRSEANLILGMTADKQVNKLAANNVPLDFSSVDSSSDRADVTKSVLEAVQKSYFECLRGVDFTDPSVVTSVAMTLDPSSVKENAGYIHYFKEKFPDKTEVNITKFHLRNYLNHVINKHVIKIAFDNDVDDVDRPQARVHRLGESVLDEVFPGTYDNGHTLSASHPLYEEPPQPLAGQPFVRPATSHGQDIARPATSGKGSLPFNPDNPQFGANAQKFREDYVAAAGGVPPTTPNGRRETIRPGTSGGFSPMGPSLKNIKPDSLHALIRPRTGAGRGQGPFRVPRDLDAHPQQKLSNGVVRPRTGVGGANAQGPSSFSTTSGANNQQQKLSNGVVRPRTGVGGANAQDPGYFSTTSGANNQGRGGAHQGGQSSLHQDSTFLHNMESKHNSAVQPGANNQGRRSLEVPDYLGNARLDMSTQPHALPADGTWPKGKGPNATDDNFGGDTGGQTIEFHDLNEKESVQRLVLGENDEPFPSGYPGESPRLVGHGRHASSLYGYNFESDDGLGGFGKAVSDDEYFSEGDSDDGSGDEGMG
ncbi:hypothetical protein HOH87_06780, partial [bacterium]|nr:hypothetical protein [bacterium]